MQDLKYKVADYGIDADGRRVKRLTDYYALTAKISFWIFCAFIIFGKDLPFRDEKMDLNDVSTSNPIAQIINITLFLTACIAIIPKIKDVGKLILREKVLTIFLLWCLLSVFWSEFSFVSFKRYFQLLTAFVVFLSILVHTTSVNDLVRFLKGIFSVFIILSFISVFTIPGAKDTEGMWRGLATSKNHLGQASLTAALVFLLSIKRAGIIQKVFLVVMIIISMALLGGSDSSTSLLTFCFIIFIWMLFAIDDYLKNLKIGRTFSITVFTILVLLVISASLFAPEYVKDLFALQGKNMTLTGRTDLWKDMMVEINHHLYLGAGYQGYWVVDNNKVLLLYNKYIWMPQQSHNGYLDMINETGLIGIILFVIMVVNYYVNLAGLKKEHIWKWFILPTLIINFTESTLFRPGIITGTFFIFSYLALFAELKYSREYEIAETLYAKSRQKKYVYQTQGVK
jgi:O-antigen ligase